MGTLIGHSALREQQRNTRERDEAATRKWIVVDMKRDWLTIFPPAP